MGAGAATEAGANLPAAAAASFFTNSELKSLRTCFYNISGGAETASFNSVSMMPQLVSNPLVNSMLRACAHRRSIMGRGERIAIWGESSTQKPINAESRALAQNLAYSEVFPMLRFGTLTIESPLWFPSVAICRRTVEYLLLCSSYSIYR